MRVDRTCVYERSIGRAARRLLPARRRSAAGACHAAAARAARQDGNRGAASSRDNILARDRLAPQPDARRARRRARHVPVAHAARRAPRPVRPPARRRSAPTAPGRPRSTCPRSPTARSPSPRPSPTWPATPARPSSSYMSSESRWSLWRLADDSPLRGHLQALAALGITPASADDCRVCLGFGGPVEQSAQPRAARG